MQTSKAEIESVMATSKAAFLAEHLKAGETYIGLLLGENGEPDQHVFLLPGEVLDVNWDDAQVWCKAQGGRAPTRREQSLLIANAKSHLKPRYYWSGEQHADYPDDAWNQYFDLGTQNYYHKSSRAAARAVRSVVI